MDSATLCATFVQSGTNPERINAYYLETPKTGNSLNRAKLRIEVNISLQQISLMCDRCGKADVVAREDGKVLWRACNLEGASSN